MILIAGFLSTLGAGYGIPSNAAITLFCESSSIFLNIRDLFSKDERGTLPYIANDLMFFFTFTVFRIVMMTYTFYVTWYEAIAMWQFRDTNQRFFSTICVALSCLTISINYYWYTLVLRNVKYALQNLGILSKPPPKADKDAKKIK